MHPNKLTQHPQIRPQLGQHRPPPHRIRRRQHIQHPRPLDRRPRLGRLDQTAHPLRPRPALRDPTPPHNPTSLQQLLPRNRPRSPRCSRRVHFKEHTRLALRRRQQRPRHRGVLHSREVWRLALAPPCSRHTARSRWLRDRRCVPRGRAARLYVPRRHHERQHAGFGYQEYCFCRPAR